MLNNSELAAFELIYVIVNYGQGSKLLHRAMHHGISGGTIMLGKGTVNNRILDFLGISEERKEIVTMVSNRVKAEQVLDLLNQEFHFEKPNHGIAFTISVCNVVGTRGCRKDDRTRERGADHTMYQSITVIVDRGKAEEVIDAATAAGSKGGTILHGRGSGIHETSKLFNMEIEPEKEVVIILSKMDKAEAIVASIREKINIDEPGNGIIFVQEVEKAYGLYE